MTYMLSVKNRYASWCGAGIHCAVGSRGTYGKGSAFPYFGLVYHACRSVRLNVGP